MDYDQLTEQEVDSLIDKAQVFYREKIRPQVYPQHKGRMLVIDLESHDWELADRAADASERLRERRPDSLFFGIKIGYKASLSFGGRRLPEEEC